MGFSFRSRGDFRNLERFLKRMKTGQLYSTLNSNATIGVNALRAATPVDTGLTGASWGYEIDMGRDGVRIIWTNTNMNNGVNIAIILQYGHGTGTGGYVAGRNYINPAIRPIFDKIAEDVWKAVTSA